MTNRHTRTIIRRASATIIHACIALAALCSTPTSHAAEPLIIKQDFEGEFVGPYTLHLEDKSRQLRIDDILSPALREKFAPVNQDTLNFGFSDSAEWLQIPLRNDTDRTIRWMLQLEDPRVNRVELYEVRPDGKYSTHLSGTQTPIQQRDVKHRQSVFALNTPPGDSEIFIRATNPGRTFVTLYSTAWSEAQLNNRNYSANLVLGVFYGAMMGLLLYNLFIYITVRDSNYFWYLLYLICAIFAYLSINGLGSLYLWGNSPYLGAESSIIAYFITFLFIFIFARGFLNTRQVSPSLDRVMVGCIIFSGIGTVSSISDISFTFNWAIAYPLSFPFPVILLVAGIMSLRKGMRQARFYVAAWATFLLSLPMFFLKDIGAIPFSPFNNFTIQLGTLLEAILLSIALADRINLLREAKDKAEAEALSILRQSKEDLEIKVLERTHQLQQQSALLDRANKEMVLEIEQRKLLEAELRKLATTDSLTGLLVRRQFFELAEKEIVRARRNNTSLAILLIDIDHFKQINDTYGHAGGDEVLKNFTAIFHSSFRNIDILCRFGGEEFIALLPETSHDVAIAAAQRLCDNVAANTLVSESNRINYRVSVGLTSLQEQDDHISNLVKRADEALYQAKHNGRNQVVAQ